MLILALDTTTRAGSVALVRGGTLIAAETGDPLRTPGERLPGDIVDLLTRHGVRLSAIDLFAVAAGPGSFTGLRIGIATMQGLALAHGKGLIGVSALDALAVSAQGATRREPHAGSDAVVVWMDAQRQEVFAAIYAGPEPTLLDGPTVAPPDEILKRWSSLLPRDRARFVGDGAIAYRSLVVNRCRGIVIDPTPLMAPAIASLAARAAARDPVPGPEAIRPLYVRRPDAELARDGANVKIDR